LFSSIIPVCHSDLLSPQVYDGKLVQSVKQKYGVYLIGLLHRKEESLNFCISAQMFLCPQFKWIPQHPLAGLKAVGGATGRGPAKAQGNFIYLGAFEITETLPLNSCLPTWRRIL